MCEGWHTILHIYIMMPRHLLGVPFWSPLLWLLPWIFRLLWPEACELMVPWKLRRTAAFPLDGRSWDMGNRMFLGNIMFLHIEIHVGDYGCDEPLNAIEDPWALHQTIHTNIQLSATDKALLDFCAEMPRKRPLNQWPPKNTPKKIGFQHYRAVICFWQRTGPSLRDSPWLLTAGLPICHKGPASSSAGRW